jgi:hypothetical protein
MTKMAKKLAPMHPGKVLREEFLVPLHLSAGALAKACDGRVIAIPRAPISAGCALPGMPTQFDIEAVTSIFLIGCWCD